MTSHIFPEFFRIVETGHEDYLALFIDNDISGDSGSLGSKGVKGFAFGVRRSMDK